MDKEPKKMTYRIEPIVEIYRDKMIIIGGTKKKAAALEGTWIRLNEKMFAFVEAELTTVLYSNGNAIGCACGGCDHGNLCEHHIAFEALKEPPQLSIESEDCRWLREYLFGLGWFAENGYLYPSLDAGLPEDKASWAPDEDEPETLDPVNEDKPLETGVDEEQKTYSRKCMHCGDSISGTDLNQVKQDIAEHTKDCPKNPANKKPANVPEIPDSSDDASTVAKNATVGGPEFDIADAMSAVAGEVGNIIDSAISNRPKKEDKKVKQPSKNTGSLFDWVENLIEFGVGQIFGDTGTAKTAFCREVAEQAADEGKKVVYWDTEGNMTRAQRAAMTEHKNITYILDRDWAHIKNMLSSELSKGSPKLAKCDLFVLDSIGVPVLGIYGTLKQNQKGNALQAMQGLLYELTKFAETNEAVVIVTNQPVSEMNKTDLEKADRHPFGDKAMFFTKEILKIVPGERTEYKTVCHILAWRSRSAGRGKMLCTVTVSDNGVEVTPTGGE